MFVLFSRRMNDLTPTAPSTHSLAHGSIKLTPEVTEHPRQHSQNNKTKPARAQEPHCNKKQSNENRNQNRTQYNDQRREEDKAEDSC